MERLAQGAGQADGTRPGDQRRKLRQRNRRRMTSRGGLAGPLSNTARHQGDVRSAAAVVLRQSLQPGCDSMSDGGAGDDLAPAGQWRVNAEVTDWPLSG